ncbi:MAG: Ribose-5-phosphate isomerase A [Chlamydiae bacterium]|nr:Ribose-5-phosphate isomerase A [Chlamydiota bacterium]
MSNQKDINNAKKAAGIAAADLVQEGMIVGLGTGSTVAYFIPRLGERCQEGLNISAVASSIPSYEQAKSEGIPLININSRTSLDLTVDGADEIDQKKRMIKGGGGALFREKIIAGMSKELVVIVDEEKLVNHLGRFPLAVEISSFAYLATLAKLEELGYPGPLRKDQSGEIYLSENGNYLVDVKLQYPCMNPEHDDEQIQSLPGVIETGFFFNMAGRVIIGFHDGHFEILP